MSSVRAELSMKELGVYFNHDTCRFESRSVQHVLENVGKVRKPLSVILQVTRRCNFSCVFCSETQYIPDPTIDELRNMRDHLEGVPRVYLSGGEPTVRKDLLEILDLFRGEFIVGLPTNASIHSRMTPALKERISFANIGLDGPRSVTSRIRGDYDAIMWGIKKAKALGIPISLSCVILTSTTEAVPFVCQIADVLEARKVKLILPIPKGNALKLPEEEYLTGEQAKEVFEKAIELKEKYNWKPKITLTTWTPEVEGYSILVYPNGNAYAWPVYDQDDRVLPLGNLIEEPIEVIWERDPYKANHLRKYLGQSILVS